MVRSPNCTAYMSSDMDESRFVFDPEASSQNAHSPERPSGFENIQAYLGHLDNSHLRAGQESSSPFLAFSGEPMYSDISEPFYDRKQSPYLHESQKLQTPPLAFSTRISPPHSKCGQTASLSECASGLGISASIVGAYGRSFVHDANHAISGIEHELTTPVNGPHFLVGDCANVTEPLSSLSTFVPSNPMDVNEIYPNANARRLTQSTISTITTSSSGSDLFKSPLTPASTRKISVSTLSSASPASHFQSFPFSPNFSFQPVVDVSGVAEPPSYPNYHETSQPSDQFIAPLQSPCLFPITSPAYHFFSSSCCFIWHPC